MSIRDEVAAALQAGLPDSFTVSASLSTPTYIQKGTYPVRVWQQSLTRDFTLGAVTVALYVWVLTGKVADDETTEDDLDAALDEVLGVLHTSDPKWVWTGAERAMMDAPDGSPQWHGYRIGVTSVGKLSKGTPT